MLLLAILSHFSLTWSTGIPFFRSKFSQILQHNLWNSAAQLSQNALNYVADTESAVLSTNNTSKYKDV